MSPLLIGLLLFWLRVLRHYRFEIKQKKTQNPKTGNNHNLTHRSNNLRTPKTPQTPKSRPVSMMASPSPPPPAEPSKPAKLGKRSYLKRRSMMSMKKVCERKRILIKISREIQVKEFKKRRRGKGERRGT